MNSTEAKKKLRSFCKGYRESISCSDVTNKTEEKAHEILSELVGLIETALNKTPPKKKKKKI